MSNIDIYTKEYLGKVFYFCLKKTGNEQEAADLAGEINLEIVQALARGTEPGSFAAWVWAVARNRWARWAARKYYHAPGQADIRDYEETLASKESVEADFVHSEELAHVRRGLAFIRTDYRQILVAHYFEEMSVSEISGRFGIPLGTVKTKLQTSRKILKEGMDMAKQFGTKSFRPESLSFSASGYQPSDLPHSAVRRKIPINILCEADNNASTIEELSMELGVAMPYMEEEVKLLVESELLRELEDGRYITDFFISPKECQNEANELSCQFAERTYGAIWDAAGRLLEKGRELGTLQGAVSDADAQAYLAFAIEQELEIRELPDGVFCKFKRRDGGSWGFYGKEAGAICRLPGDGFSNNSIVWYPSDEKFHGQAAFAGWRGYQNAGSYGSLPYRQDVPDRGHLAVLKAAAEGRDFSDCSATEKECLRQLTGQGFCVQSENGRVQVAALTVRMGAWGRIMESFQSLPEYGGLKEETHAYYKGLRKIIARYCAPHMKKDFDFYVGMSTAARGILARLWKDKGLYRGGNAQFAALYYGRVEEVGGCIF